MKNDPLNIFLNDHRIIKESRSDTTSITHTSLGGDYPRGSYYIPFEERDELYRLITRAAFVDNKNVCLTEKPTENSVLRIDVDLRYNNINNELHRQYTDRDIKMITKTYNDVLTRYFDIDADDLMCYVMEKEQPYIDPKNDKIIKDGIHLMYPNIILSKKNYSIVRRMVIHQLKEKLSKLLESNIETVDKVIDSAIVDGNWLLYGCAKPGSKPYLLTKIYDGECNDIIDQIRPSPDALVDILKVNFPQDTKSIKIRPEHEAIFDLTETKATSKSAVINSVEALLFDGRNNTKIASAAASVDLDEVTKLIHILSPDRANDRNSWIRVCWCLKNIHPRLEKEWILFSRQSPKYDEESCQREWIRATIQEGLNIGSLHQWAKEDNPEEYAQIMRQKIDHIIKRAGSCTSEDVARAIHHLFKDKFVTTDGGKKSEKFWYKFENHRWISCDGKIAMQKIMSESLPQFCRATKANINRVAAQTQDDELKARLDKHDTELQNLINKLKDSTFKEKVYKECIHMFHDEKFGSKLDENTDYIGCENGVYNLRLGEFRDGLPDDYVSISTGINYQIEDEYGPYNDNHPIIREINDFFNKIQPVEAICKYLKLLLGSCLYGRNTLEEFYILEGVGGNGKSKLIELIEHTLGPYTSSISSSYFTGKSAQSAQATPDLAKVINTRIVTSQETEEGEKFNIAKLKQTTGGDKLPYRELYGAAKEGRPKFTILMAVNHLPALPADDQGTWRRIRLIRFLSRFVDNPDETSEYEHKKDPLLSEKMRKWSEGFLFLLFNWHREFRTSSCRLIAPPEVLKTTDDYKKQFDQYSEFVEKYTCKKPGGFLQLDALYAQLKIWWSESSNGSRHPDKKAFQSIMEKRFGTRVERDTEMGHGWRDREMCDPSTTRVTDNNIGMKYFDMP